MYSLVQFLQRWAFARRPDNRFALVLGLFVLVLTAPGAFAQTHVTNPFQGAMFYVNPDYAVKEVGAAAAAQPAGSTLANQMAVVATYPTAIWMDHIGAITGGAGAGGRMSLQDHITAALAQQSASGTNQPIVVELVIYDLPDRDCAALASNGELSIAGGDTIIGPDGNPKTLTGTGIQEYEGSYITPIFNALQTVATNPNIRFVLIVEDDSLPNLITNVGEQPNPAIAACVAANGGVSGAPSLTGVYAQAIEFALSTFHKQANVYNYLDVGHHGWLGWPNNFQPAVNFLTSVAKQAGGVATVDGFITNTANYGPTKEPFFTATTSVGGQAADSATFYHSNPFIDEEDYAAAMDAAFVTAGFPSTVGFLIDTSRNGWGSSSRPKAASTSTVLDTFVNASKIDLRTDMGQWCNQPFAGLGVPPTVTPGGFANLQAYVWVKPPGESDGNYPGSVFNGVTSTTGDPNCNPTHNNSLGNNQPTNAVPNSPHAGTFWTSYFTMLVQNAFPPVNTSGGFSISAGDVSVLQGQSATDSVVVTSNSNTTGVVTLGTGPLPSGVTASFNPTTVTGSAGSTLTLVAAGNAATGPVKVTITGTSSGTGTTPGTTVSTTITVTVVPKPDFTMTVSPATVNVTGGTTANATVTIGFVGGLTGSVAVQASGQPSGVNVNFAPNSVNSPGGTITASFFAQPGIANGTSTVTITGTNGQGSTAITHTVTVTLNVGVVNNNPGFTLTPAAASLNVQAGGSATDTITITDTGGFTGPVTLTAVGAPAGVTATFGTNPATSTSVLTVATTTAAATGPFTLTINGTGTSSTNTTLTGSTMVTVNVGGNGGSSCHIGYTITNQWIPGFQVALSIGNTGTTPINGWTLTWSFANGQTITQLWNGIESQTGANVTVLNEPYNANIPAGTSYTAAGFTGTWSGTNSVPTAFSLNGTPCAVN
jgi:cellulose 1,4-beta-cellobiosidase